MAEFIEEGIVLSVEGNIAQVKITPKGTCPDSHAGCPVKALAEGQEFTTEVDNLISAQPGQKVLVEIKVTHLHKGLMLMFILPLAFFLGYPVGVFIANLVNGPEETFAIIFMCIGFLLPFFILAVFGKKFSARYTIKSVSAFWKI